MTERVREIQKSTGASLRMVCEVIGVGRSGLYRKRSLGPGRLPRGVPDGEVVPALKRLAGEFPTYGYRRLKVLVSRELGRPVNAKRIRRLMLVWGLLTYRRVERARPPCLPAGRYLIQDMLRPMVQIRCGRRISPRSLSGAPGIGF